MEFFMSNTKKRKVELEFSGLLQVECKLGKVYSHWFVESKKEEGNRAGNICR
jgi:hypothetical protein